LSQWLSDSVVSVALEVQTSFQFYNGGVYTAGPECGWVRNHAVLLVGQEDDVYHIKNSWGTSWGEDGYMRMAVGETETGTCGVAGKFNARVTDPSLQ